ncbi:MAG TPA: peptidylprolyl isomerase [Gemmataceae bacterium]|jgi:peptidyl-prolyl cis-trans isomerase B (cyclophilin B)
MVNRAARWGIVGLVLAAATLGCGKSGDHAAPTVAVPGPSNDAAATSASDAPSSPKPLPFSEAVSEDSPEEQLPPPDQTVNGLATGLVRIRVQKLWDTIAFTTPAGKKLAYSAVLDTEFGPVTIALRPDVAPNHVRNFVALARAGFYDGLVFERVIEQQGDGPDSRLELIEGGCPLGTGEPGVGHLGYWLYPEFSDVKHEPGTVGACLNGAEDTAGCRFYVTLSSAPAMDGNFTVFGKVTTGLDVIRTIAKQPRADGSPRPDKPVLIRKVTIQTREVE